jgi:nucleotide-binding universal stress UspA family protein
VRGTVKQNGDLPPKLMIGVDGSPEAEQAVRAVGMRVWPEGTAVRIIAVDDGTSPTRIADIFPVAHELIRGCNEESAVAARTMVE